MSDSRVAWVYGLKEKGSDKIRYVGKTVSRRGVKDRVYHHKWGAENRFKGVPSQRWIRKIGSDRVEFEILEETTEELAGVLERQWIRTLKLRGEADLNITEGGDGRTSRETSGELNPRSVFTWSQVRELRERAKKEYVCSEREARKMGVTRSAVDKILRNTSWVDPDYNPGDRITYRTLNEDPLSRETVYRRFSNKEVEDIRKKYLEGYTVDELAQEFETGGTTVRRILFEKYGSEESRNRCRAERESRVRGKIPKENLPLILKLHREGATYAEIARRFGVTPPTAKRYVERAIMT